MKTVRLTWKKKVFLLAALLFSIVAAADAERTSRDCSAEIAELEKKVAALTKEDADLKRQPVIRWAEKELSVGNVAKKMGNVIEVNRRFYCAYNRGATHQYQWNKQRHWYHSVCNRCSKKYYEWNDLKNQIGASDKRLARRDEIKNELSGLKNRIEEVQTEKRRLLQEERDAGRVRKAVAEDGETSAVVARALARLGARQVEYLGGTGDGSGYIDTGIVGKSDIKVDFEVSHWTANWFCFGSRVGGKSAFVMGRYNSKTLYYDYDARIRYNVATDTVSKYRIVKDRQNNYCYNSEGTLIWSGANPPATFNSNLTMYIFTINDSGHPFTSKSEASDARRYYSFKIWDDDVLVRDFIPVRVGSVGYLFDRVSLKLFGNSGTGAFVVGPDIEAKDNGK